MKDHDQHHQQLAQQSLHAGDAGTEKRSRSPTDPFITVNERPVDDISLDLFYKPHTVTLLAVSIISVMYFAFVRYVFMNENLFYFICFNEFLFGYFVLHNLNI